MTATVRSHEIVEKALGLSKADACAVIVGETSEVNLRWANNTLTTNGAARDSSITVISVVGRSFGARSRSSVDGSEALEDLVRASEIDAREAEDARDYAELLGPATPGIRAGTTPGGGPGVAADPLAPFDAPAEPTTAAVFRPVAAALGESFGAARADGTRMYGFARHERTTSWLGTSAGLRLRFSQPTGHIEWNAKSAAARGSVWHGQGTRDFTDVDVPGIDATLRRRLSWCERSVDVPAGRYETLLPPSAVADLMLYAYWSAAGRDAAEGRTVFSAPGGGTRVGESIGPAGLSMVSDPADPELGCLPFVLAGGSSATSSVFDNGLALSRTHWIEDGRLAALVQTRASARSAGVEPTPFVDNLTVDGGGTASLDEMVAKTRRGLLLTCLWYIREVDPRLLLLTGLTRDGVYLVENGEIVGAVNNFRFNESPVDLLGRLTEVGATSRTLPREWADWFTNARMPAMRVPDFNMSSVSPAS